MRFALPTLIIVIASACGHTPSRLGVIVEDVAVTRSRLGPSATDVALREFMPGSTRRVKEADVLGDDKPERLIESADHKGHEIRTQSGDLILQIRTDEYLTDFGAIPTTGTSKRLIVLYTYPNNERGGTFTVMN